MSCIAGLRPEYAEELFSEIPRELFAGPGGNRAGTRSPSPGNHVYEFEVTSQDNLDDEVQHWMAKRYRVECQEHLGERK